MKQLPHLIHPIPNTDFHGTVEFKTAVPIGIGPHQCFGICINHFEHNPDSGTCIIHFTPRRNGATISFGSCGWCCFCIICVCIGWSRLAHSCGGWTMVFVSIGNNDYFWISEFRNNAREFKGFSSMSKSYCGKITR